MRKILIYLLCLLALVGCTKNNNTTTNPETTTPVETVEPSTTPTIEKETIGVDVEGIYFETTSDKGTYTLHADGSTLQINDGLGNPIASGKLISAEELNKYVTDDNKTTLNNLSYVINETEDKNELIIAVKDFDQGLYFESTSDKDTLESLLAQTKIYLNTLK